MLEKIIALDKQLFVYLNSLGTPAFDPLWLIITRQIYWTPFFLLLLYLVFRKIGWKQTVLVVFCVAILILFADQTSNLFKNYFQRLRPCNNPDFVGIIRSIKPSLTFSFFSGHAANTAAVAMFLYLIMRKHYRYFGLIIFWPLIFAYSRIYLGLHYPIDILTGYFIGCIFGLIVYKIFDILRKKYLI